MLCSHGETPSLRPMHVFHSGRGRRCKKALAYKQKHWHAKRRTRLHAVAGNKIAIVRGQPATLPITKMLHAKTSLE